MKRPTELKVLGTDWDIEWVERIEHEDEVASGLTDGEMQRIGVTTTMHPQEEANTVIHESLHALGHYVWRGVLPPEVQEQAITLMAPALRLLIVNNPHLVAYLRSRS